MRRSRPDLGHRATEVALVVNVCTCTGIGNLKHKKYIRYWLSEFRSGEHVLSYTDTDPVPPVLPSV